MNVGEKVTYYRDKDNHREHKPAVIERINKQTVRIKLDTGEVLRVAPANLIAGQLELID